MTFLLPLIALVAGLLAASSVIIQKLPDAAELIKKMKPYEGFIGAGALAMGVLSILDITKAFRFGMLNGSFNLACIVSCIVMGFLLGYPILQDYIFDDLSEEARTKSEEIYERLTPYKVTSGLVGIGSAIYIFLF